MLKDVTNKAAALPLIEPRPWARGFTPFARKSSPSHLCTLRCSYRHHGWTNT